MGKNKDCRDGLKFLFVETRKMDIDIRKYPWIADLSMLLSERNQCLKFWLAVYKQQNLHKITRCRTVFDILFSSETNLCTWSRTTDGHEYWKHTFRSLFWKDLHEPHETSERCRRIPLKDVRLYVM